MAPDQASPTATREDFGRLPDGRAVERVRLRGAGGFELAVITFGAAVQALQVPDRLGRCADVVLGHDTLAPYLAGRKFFGATVGRYATRIAGGSFRLDGERFQLPVNDGPNSLHGGLAGFDRRLWTLEALDQGPAPSVTLSLVSADGEEGYPGTLRTRLTYALVGDSTFSIAYEAVTDRPTVVNLTHHGFFQLAGAEAATDVLDQVLTIEADAYLPIDATAIPLGGPESVAGTPFDFTRPRPIGDGIRAAHEQIRRGRGYDHTFCLRGASGGEPRPAARVRHPASGRVMEILTDQPGLQFYSGNFLDGAVAGKGGRPHRQSDAFCLEPLAWPDAPNRPDYPSARLDPGETYRQLSLYRFSVA